MGPLWLAAIYPGQSCEQCLPAGLDIPPGCWISNFSVCSGDSGEEYSVSAPKKMVFRDIQCDGCALDLLRTVCRDTSMKKKLKKSSKKFAVIKKSSTFASPERWTTGQRFGSLAQLVQSVCLTSRGSGVRLPQLPPKKTSSGFLKRSFSMYMSHPNVMASRGASPKRIKH